MTQVRVRRGTALWRSVPGFVTVAATDGRSVRAGGSAPSIWALLPDRDEPSATLESIVERLAIDHGASPADVERDVVRVIAAWEAIGCAVRDA